MNCTRRKPSGSGSIVPMKTNSETPVDKTLRFWVDVAYENVKSDHPKLTKRQLIAQILHQYQERGDAMRYLDANGKIRWKASPRFLTMLADAERDAQDELQDFP
jgi:hypothetical protein